MLASLKAGIPGKTPDQRSVPRARSCPKNGLNGHWSPSIALFNVIGWAPNLVRTRSQGVALTATRLRIGSMEFVVTMSRKRRARTSFFPGAASFTPVSSLPATHSQALLDRAAGIGCRLGQQHLRLRRKRNAVEIDKRLWFHRRRRFCHSDTHRDQSKQTYRMGERATRQPTPRVRLLSEAPQPARRLRGILASRIKPKAYQKERVRITSTAPLQSA